MRVEVLPNPSTELLATLIRLVGESCPFPSCSREVAYAVVLRENKRQAASFDNSIALCANHAEQASKGEIEPSLLKTIRQLLRPARAGRSTTGARTLTTREEYLGTIRDRVSSHTTSLRCVYVGPLPLHPDWYFTLRDGATTLPNMDRAVARRLDDPRCSTYLILRNHERYVEKVKETVPADLLPALGQHIIDRAEQVYTSASSNHVVCADTGVFHIPIIVDNAVISAYRSNPQSPIDGGLLVTDRDHVQWERTAFDRMFEHYRSLEPAGGQVEAIKRFIRATLLRSSP